MTYCKQTALLTRCIAPVEVNSEFPVMNCEEQSKIGYNRDYSNRKQEHDALGL